MECHWQLATDGDGYVAGREAVHPLATGHLQFVQILGTAEGAADDRQAQRTGFGVLYVIGANQEFEGLPRLPMAAGAVQRNRTLPECTVLAH